MRKTAAWTCVIALLAASSPVFAGPVRHKVRKGENLYRIARSFGVGLGDLRRANGLTSERLVPGDLLTIPSKRKARPKGRQIGKTGIGPQGIASDREQPARELTVPERVVQLARKMLNVPYKFGGETLRGIDCSAYVQRVFRFLNIDLPRTAREQFQRGQEVTRDDLATGDLIFFQTYAKFPSHVGIYLGENRFIHASSIDRKVSIDSLEDPFYSSRFIGARRLFEAAPGVPDLSAAVSG